MADDVVVVERRRGSGLRVVLGLVLILVIAVVVIVVVLATKESSDAKDDVSIRTCQATNGSKPTASGQINNTTSKDSNYTVRVKFLDNGGNTVSEGETVVKDVGSKHTATWRLTGVQSADGPVHCDLAGVSRTHVPGQ